jgi:hypothetical protein
MLSKELFGYISVLLVIGVTVVYVRHIFQGKIKPHIFTWIIWALTTGIAAAARSVSDAGPGAWGQWTAAVGCILVAVIAAKYGDKNITRSDRLAFIGALTAIPVWLLTHNPLTAVIIVTAIDVVGYYPTARKSYYRPFEEATFNYVIANVIHILSLLATTEYTITTTFFSVVIFWVNGLFVAMVWWRRGQMRNAAAP